MEREIIQLLPLSGFKIKDDYQILRQQIIDSRTSPGFKNPSHRTFPYFCFLEQKHRFPLRNFCQLFGKILSVEVRGIHRVYYTPYRICHFSVTGVPEALHNQGQNLSLENPLVPRHVQHVLSHPNFCFFLSEPREIVTLAQL